MQSDNESATSQTTAHLLLVAITVILAILLFLMLHMPDFDWAPTEPPVLFKLETIRSSAPTFESQISLRSIVQQNYPNKELSAKIYCNDELLPCTIKTIRTYEFIPTHHYGVNRIWGQGGNSDLWSYNQLVWMDLSNGFIHPGDVIRVDIIKTATDTVISRDSMKA